MFQCDHRRRQGIRLVKTVNLVLHLLLVVASVTTIAGILILWKNFVYDYSFTSTVFDNANDVAHLVSTNFM